MKHLNPNVSKADQSFTQKKSQKHDANLQKSSALYFQIGLILCLLGTYLLFEMQFESNTFQPIITDDTSESLVVDIVKPFKVEVENVKKAPRKQKPVTLIDVIKVVDDAKVDVEKHIVTTKPEPVTQPINPNDLDTDIVDLIDDVIVDFIKIEKAPIYPGCETLTTETARKQCFSERITKLVSRKFNGQIANEFGLTGVQRLYAQFTVTSTGVIDNIKIRAPHVALEKEAKRVINKLPQMVPGMQRNIPVDVVYNLPITFKVYD